MNEQYYIGIDLGTSSIKAALFDVRGKLIESVSHDYPVDYPKNGWAEQSPQDWFDASVCSLRELAVRCQSVYGISLLKIKGIGFSGQMHGGVFLDADGNVLRPAILWCDSRAKEESEYINRVVGKEKMESITGNYAMANFTAAKILWLRNHEPKNYNRLRMILLPKDYLRYRMTGMLSSEVSDASGTNLLDVKSNKWSKEILNALDISEDILPPVLGSSDIAGYLTKEYAELTGLPFGIPVVSGAADNASAAIGMGCVTHGMTMLTVGTSGVILSQTNNAVSVASYGMSLFRSAVPDSYLVLGVTLSAAHSMNWFVKTFCGEEQMQAGKDESVYHAIETYVESTPIGSNGLIYFPHLSGGRSPYFDEYARGMFMGFNATHGKSEMARAVMEGVVFSLRQYYELMKSVGVVSNKVYACGGGLNSATWRQIFADNFNSQFFTSPATESAALGGAILAAVGTEAYISIAEACQSMVTESSEILYPQNVRDYADTYEIYCMVYPALKEIFLKMNK